MSKKVKERTFEEAVAWLRENGFEVMEVPSNPNRVFVKKHGCSAAIERSESDGVKLFAFPGALRPRGSFRQETCLNLVVLQARICS